MLAFIWWVFAIVRGVWRERLQAGYDAVISHLIVAMNNAFDGEVAFRMIVQLEALTPNQRARLCGQSRNDVQPTAYLIYVYYDNKSDPYDSIIAI